MPDFFDLFSTSHVTPSIFFRCENPSSPRSDLRFSDFHPCLHRCLKGFPIQSHPTNLAIHGLWMVYVEIHPQPMMRLSYTKCLSTPFLSDLLKIPSNSRQFEAHPIWSIIPSYHWRNPAQNQQVSPLPCVQPCWWHELSRSNHLSQCHVDWDRPKSSGIFGDISRNGRMEHVWYFVIVKTVEPW